jgi:hypothetical protein
VNEHVIPKNASFLTVIMILRTIEGTCDIERFGLLGSDLLVDSPKMKK